MIFKKWLQQITGTMLAMILIGCATPVTSVPTQPQAVIESFTPTQAEMVVVNPTSTQTLISSFEECIALGNPIQSTFPRQCTTNNGQIFKETLSKGVVFSKVYGEKGHMETAYSVISTIDGGYLITGQADSYQCLIRKLDSSGEKEWEYALGLELRDEFQFMNGLFTCWSARQITDGGYVVIATGRHEMGIKSNSFLLKLDRDGNRKSAEEFRWKSGLSLELDQEGKPFWRSLFGLAGELMETSDNGYAVVGRFWVNAPDDSMHIFRADANENYLWERNLCRDKNVREEWEKKIVCSNNNLWDGIQSQDGGFVFTGGFTEIWLVKTNSDGFIEWIKTFDGASGHAVISTSDGGFLIAGNKNGDGILIKTDSAGNLQWSKTFGGDRYDQFNKMIVNSRGEIIVIGSTESFGEGAENIWLLGIDLSDLE